MAGDRMSSPPTGGRIILSDNLPVLQAMNAESVGLIYVDPPFNTGKIQSRTRIRVERDEDGDRTGFKGTRYRTEVVGRSGYDDRHDDYIGFLEPRLREAHRILEPTGSFFLHIDYREAHYCKILLDEIFGRMSFMNEIIWAYDYGARSKRKWPAKHDTIFWYAKDPTAYTFNFDVMDRIPYMAPGLVGKEKAARGKTPTDVWWHTIVSPTGREKTGYPTQKPLGIMERIVKSTPTPATQYWTSSRGAERRAKLRRATAGTTYWLTRIPRRRVSWPNAWPTMTWRPSGLTGNAPTPFNGVCGRIKWQASRRKGAIGEKLAQRIARQGDEGWNEERKDSEGDAKPSAISLTSWRDAMASASHPSPAWHQNSVLTGELP